jgi:cell filamentation protein
MTHIPPFTPIEVDRMWPAIMGVAFPTLEILNGVARAIGTNIYEGLEPTPLDIEAIRDHCTGMTTFEEMVAATREQYGTKGWPRKTGAAQKDERWDSEYTEADTGVFYNLLNEAKWETLAALEYRAVAKGTYDLLRELPEVKSTKDVQGIHKRLFGRVYPWAGKLRTVNMRKGDSTFLYVELFPTGARWLDGQIASFREKDGTNAENMAKDLAYILDSLNHFHPFREGNGRTQRLAVELLAARKGYDLDLNPPDDTRTHEAYMSGTIGGNAVLLTELILGCLTPRVASAPKKNHPQRKGGRPK